MSFLKPWNVASYYIVSLRDSKSGIIDSKVAWISLYFCMNSWYKKEIDSCTPQPLCNTIARVQSRNPVN